jgi:transposase
VWIVEGKNARPVVTVTGSHRHFCIFGAVSLEGKQIFRQFDRFNDDSFYNFLKQVHHKFRKCYLFLDKAPQHYKSHKIKQYLRKHKQDLIPVWLPTASPEFMVLEECWSISKKDLLVLTYYSSFTDFRKEIIQYFRTMHFNLNMQNYLVRDMSAYLC